MGHHGGANTMTPTNIVTPLSEADLAMFARIGVTRGTAVDLAGIRRVTTAEARDNYGIRYRSEHLDGIVFPYLDPETDQPTGYRLRRDHPEVDQHGKPIAKYVSSQDRKHL
jgi:hypothetical protein